MSFLAADPGFELAISMDFNPLNGEYSCIFNIVNIGMWTGEHGKMDYFICEDQSWGLCGKR